MQTLTVPPGDTKRDLSYLPQLDGLRTLAVGTVMLTHFWGLQQLPHGLGRLDIFTSGVPLFFALSGFLITRILLRYRDDVATGDRSRSGCLRQFYVRRVLRIFPLYYLVIMVTFAIDMPPVRDTIVWLATYTQNYYITQNQDWMGSMGHFWTLAVEEQFYLVWPWLVLGLPRRWLLPVTVLLLTVAPLYRLFALHAYPNDVLAGDCLTFTHTFARLDTLGAGALLAMVLPDGAPRDRVHRNLNRWVAPGGILLMVLFDALRARDIAIGAAVVLRDSALAMVLVWVVATASRGFPGVIGRFLAARPVVYLGKISYGLYVFHNLMPPLLTDVLPHIGLAYPGRGFAGFVVSSLATVAVASVSWHIMERPLNRLKDRIATRK